MTFSLAQVVLALGGSFAGSIVTKATIVAVMTLLAVRWTSQSRAATRHLLIVAGFTMLALLPAVTVFVPSVEWRVISPDVVAPALETHADRELRVAASPGRAVPLEEAISRPPAASATQLLMLVWAAGAAICLVPMCLGLWQVRRLCQSGLPWLQGAWMIRELASNAGIRQSVDVLIHESIASPMTCGALRPVVLLPPGAKTWHVADLSRALIHELEHVRRRDWLVHSGARCLCALYWFHPVIWMCHRHLSLEAERACDDTVLESSEPTSYAEQLVRLAEGLLSRPRATIAMANRCDLAARVAGILDNTQRRGRVGALPTAIVLAIAALLALIIAPVRAVSQTQSTVAGGHATFEVASIRQNKSGGVERGGGFQPGGRFITVNLPLRQVIAWAYGELFPVPDRQILGGPSWIDADRWDINARAATDAPRSEMQMMLRNLLADRFKVVAREEKRELPVYTLRLSKTGARGLQLKASSGDDCVMPGRAGQAGADLRPCGNVAFIGGHGIARAATMDAVARYLLPAVDRLVLNRTELPGTFSFDVEFAMPVAAVEPGTQRPEVVASDKPSIFTVLQEQLGLRLQAERASVGVLVIDSVERPTPD